MKNMLVPLAMAAILAGCTSFDSDEVIALKPFPKLAEPRSVTGGEAKLIVPTPAVREMVPAVGPAGMSYLCHTVISKDMKRVYFLSRSVEESMEGVKKFKGVNWFTTAFTSNADGTNIRGGVPTAGRLASIPSTRVPARST